MPVTQAEVIDALRPVEDPELHRSIVDLGMVKNVGIDGGDVQVLVALTVPGCPLRAEIDRRVTEAVAGARRRRTVGLDFTVMTDDELRALREQLHGDPAVDRRHARGPRPRRGPGHPVRRSVVTHPGAARSRRARAASASRRSPRTSPSRSRERGRSVAVVDADVWGFSIPKMLGVDRPPVVHRRDAPAARGARRALHLDGLLRRRGPARHLARPDAAQGARAVPHRRVLGRARLPARRPAARHRRHLDLARADPAARRDVRRHHAAAGRAAGRAARRLHGRRRSTSR